MKFRTSLRVRVSLAFSVLGLVVSLGLAQILYLLTLDMEERLIAETLSTELEDYITRYRLDPTTPPPTSTMIRTYVILANTLNTPTILRTLKPGLQQMELDDKKYYAEMRVDEGRQFIILYNAKQIHHRENQFKLFLAIGALVITLLSALLGFWLAGRVITPVRELATRVAGLRPEDNPAPLAEDFPGDEVGTLAREFDAYLLRLSALITREQDFTANVSHELRTPLAVIEGACEVLLDDPNLDKVLSTRVQRIARSAHEMSALVTALLLLAREEKDSISKSSCAVDQVLRQVVEDHRHLLLHKPVKIKLDIQVQTALPIECTLIRVVLANLIRNALHYTQFGQVSIFLDKQGVLIDDTGIGVPKEQLQQIFDRFYSNSSSGEGIGLSLVKRICERYHWHIDIKSIEAKGTQIRLSL